MSLNELKEEAKTLCECVVCSNDEAYGIAPGRVEILGNHTDYNEGYVLCAAIDRYTVVTGKKSGGVAASVYSDAYERLLQFNVENIQKDGTAPWLDYVMAVVDQLKKADKDISGFETAIVSNVPTGAGLSSSAALEVATAKFLCGIFDIEMSDADTALLCRSAENDFVGMKCGIMDQWASIHGKKDSILKLDCRTLNTEVLTLNENVCLVLADTKAEHTLVDGTYNLLQENCFAAAEFFAGQKEGITHLRDITVEEFEDLSGQLDDKIARKAAHIVHENDRVLRGTEFIKSGDVESFGRLMFESHKSSINNFGNSGSELDAMVTAAKGLKGCYGSRLSGGGFAGCTVNLVDAEKADSFASELSTAYEKHTGITPEMHICRLADGARLEKND
ncbi:MAG: galactokinase [Planctomycetota bacterium]|jgi:galactokinase